MGGCVGSKLPNFRGYLPMPVVFQNFLREDFDDQLMIDDEDLVDEQNIEDPLDALDDENENQVRLEKLPRPVNELNCRQARTFLVKLLRASNGGNNPVRILHNHTFFPL